MHEFRFGLGVSDVQDWATLSVAVESFLESLSGELQGFGTLEKHLVVQVSCGLLGRNWLVVVNCRPVNYKKNERERDPSGSPASKGTGGSHRRQISCIC